MKIEHRFAAFRAEGGVVTGVVVPYGAPSEIGTFRETILPGAFGAIGEIRANVLHDRNRLFAVNRDGGGLVLADGADALRARVDLPEHGEGPAIRELVERGVLAGFSVEMAVKRDAWAGRDRTIESARMLGLALVDVPAHAGAVAALEARWKAARAPVARPVPLWALS